MDLQSILKNQLAGGYVARAGSEWRTPEYTAEDVIGGALEAEYAGHLARRAAKALALSARTARHKDYANAPFSYVLVALIASLPSRGIVATKTTSDRAGSCDIEGVVPSCIWAYEGIAKFHLEKKTGRIQLDAEIVIEGQYVDWGHGRRTIRDLFRVIDAHLATLHELSI